jgi:hypothetical protein
MEVVVLKGTKRVIREAKK